MCKFTPKAAASSVIASLGLVLALTCWRPIGLLARCEPGDLSFYGYSFLNPAIAGLAAGQAPFYLEFGQVYKRYFKTADEAQEDENLLEWRQRFCDGPTLPDLRQVIYELSDFELESIRNQIASGGGWLSGLGGGNSFISYLRRYGCTDVVDYLVFAKRCEQSARKPLNAWDATPVRDPLTMRERIAEARRGFSATESHFLKLRYAYQAIRMAHYMKDYKLTLDLCDYYLPKIDNDPSIIEYWIMGHKAGALQAMGRLPESAYLYSRVFENSAGKRESAYLSFRINTDEEWRQCLLLCRDNHERATLYALRAHGKDAQLLEEMRRIYVLDPKHQALELLLFREVQLLEKDLLGAEFNHQAERNKRQFGIPRANAGQRVIDLRVFVQMALKQGRVARPERWQLAEGYLQLLAGDYYYAARTFDRTLPLLQNDTLREQLNVFRLVLDILALDKANDEAERRIAGWRQKSDLYARYMDFSRFTRDKMRRLYRQSGQRGKAFLLDYTIANLSGNPEMDILNELITLCRKDRPTPLERSLIAKPGGGTIEYDLLNLKAGLFIQQGQMGAALQTFKEIPATEWEVYGIYSPFVDRLKDCIKCAIPDTLQVFNKAELIQVLIDLESKAIAEPDPNLAAMRYYRLGMGYYNLTYFGHAWKVADAFRDPNSAQRVLRNKGQTVFTNPDYPLGNAEYFDCSRARFFFEKARTVATEPEIAARATFMAARCEANAYYTQLPTQTFDNFTLLRNSYSQTQFYKRVVEECRYFKAFTTK